MTDHPSQPLIRPPSDYTEINAGSGPGRSSTKAYRVAGITLLACLLIAGQALTAYFVLSQKGQIKELEDRTNGMSKDLGSRRAGTSSHMKMSMNPISMLSVDSTDDKDSADLKEGSSSATPCQLEYVGLLGRNLPNFHPVCDEQGNFLPKQCWNSVCWCVDASGQDISGFMMPGSVKCGAKSGPRRTMLLPNMDLLGENLQKAED